MSRLKALITVCLAVLTSFGCAKDKICISELQQSLQEAQSDQSIYNQTEIDLMLTQIFRISEDDFQPSQLKAILKMLKMNLAKKDQTWFKATLFITLDYLQQRASFEQKYCANELFYGFPKDDPARQTWDVRELKDVALQFAKFGYSHSTDYHTLAKVGQLFYVLKKPSTSRIVFMQIYATDPLRFETPEMIRKQNIEAGEMFRYKQYGDTGSRQKVYMDFYQINKNYQDEVPVCKYLERLGLLAPIPMRSSDIFQESYINRFKNVLPGDIFEKACKSPSVFHKAAVDYNSRLRALLAKGDYVELQKLTYEQDEYLRKIWNSNCPDTLKITINANNIEPSKK